MPKIRAVCPECAAVLALAESVTPGKNIRCPKCQTVFPVPDDGAGAAPARERPMPASRPRRFKAKKQSSQAGIVIAFIAASILILAGAGIGGYFLFKSKRGGATAQKRPTPTDVQTGTNVGQVAPEITAEDLDGVQFKLSDYRGKVVLLDFWGHW
jgi:phage FluMu protein Com